MSKATYNTRFQLTPMPASNRWRKIFRGKIYYVGIGNCTNKTDREGYAIALAEWKEKKRELDNTPSQEEQERYAEVKRRERELPNKIQEWGFKDPHAQSVVSHIQAEREKDQVLVSKIEGTPSGTLQRAVDDFVGIKLNRHQLGDLSADRVQSVQQALRHVLSVLGTSTPISILNAGTGGEESVKKYFGVLVEGVAGEQIGRTTAHERWAIFREWISSIYTITPPRNLRSRDFLFRRPPKSIVIFSPDEIKILLTDTPEKFRLWVLLMLNCGFTQKDVADLKPSEVDWENGRILRPRSKMAHLPDSPIVNYLLWRETFALLKLLGRHEGERVFLNRDGKPLVYRQYRGQKMLNQDGIYDKYRRLFPENRKPLKAIRKTGASKLEEDDTFFACIQHYLNQRGTIADRHYRKQSQERFDRAITWLGEQFGIK